MFSNVLVIGNDKGGAGKSTLTANLAGQLAVAGWRTLVVDLDYQGDVSEHLGYADNPENDGGRNLMNAMVDGEPLRVLKDVGDIRVLTPFPLDAGRGFSPSTWRLIVRTRLGDGAVSSGQ